MQGLAPHPWKVKMALFRLRIVSRWSNGGKPPLKRAGASPRTPHESLKAYLSKIGTWSSSIDYDHQEKTGFLSDEEEPINAYPP